MCRYKFITTDRKMLKRLITTHRPTLNLGCGIVVGHELVEFVPVNDQEYEEVIEEYEKEILVQEGAPEPVGADLTDPSPV